MEGGCIHRLESRLQAWEAQAGRVAPCRDHLAYPSCLARKETRLRGKSMESVPLRGPNMTDQLWAVLSPITGFAVPLGFPVVIWYLWDESPPPSVSVCFSESGCVTF